MELAAHIKAEIAKLYRAARGLYHDHIPSVIASEAFADEVLDIPQIAGMIAGEEIRHEARPTANLGEGWQPIETAPKDRWILSWDADGGHELIRHNEIFAMAGEDADGWMGATHWMPLPPPPTETPK